MRIDPDAPNELLETAEQLGRGGELPRRLGQLGVQYAEEKLSQKTAILRYSQWLHKLARADRNND